MQDQPIQQPYSILHDKANPRDPQEEHDRKHNAERQKRKEHRLAFTVSELRDLEFTDVPVLRSGSGQICRPARYY